ncbi:MAG: AAA family ATPase [Terriglobales bacterium]
MATKFTLFAAEEAERRQLEQVLLACSSGVLAGRALTLPQPFDGGADLAAQVQAQAPEAILVALPEGGAADREAAYALIAWLRAQLPQAAVMAMGPMDVPGAIVAAMRAGASEYLERPLRSEALADAVVRAVGARQALVRQNTRGKLLLVLGARGGCGATTVAVNLALALQARRRQDEEPVLLLDAAPLGHAALHLNLKVQFTLADLLSHSARLDTAVLDTLVCRHDTGLQLLAGPAAPLNAAVAEHPHAAWLELLLTRYPLIVADLSARLDGLTQALLERADRILFIAQTDMVSLWSAAKVRQYLDAPARLHFEMVLNRYTGTPATDLDQVASITQAQMLWKLPNAYAEIMEAIEHGQPPVLKGKSELARSYFQLAALLLGRPPARRRSWLPFLRLRAAEG